MIGEKIEQMNEEELLQTYLNLQQDADLIERDQKLIKAEFQRRLDEKGLTKMELEHGVVNVVNQERNILNQAKVKEHLGPMIEQFMKKSTCSFVKIMSNESRNAMLKAMENKE